jgi:hypothetical protein
MSSIRIRVGLVAASVMCLSLIATNAHASGSHTLLARAHNNTSKLVSFPELTTFVEATHEQGVGGVNDHIHNHAEVDSDTGHLLATVQAIQTNGATGTIQPNSWNVGATLEENVIYSVKAGGASSASGLRGWLALPASTGTISHIEGMTMTLSAKLSIDECQVGATRTISYPKGGPMTASDLVENVSCPAGQGRVARLENSALYVEVPNFGKVAPIVASVSIGFNYAGGFQGTIDGGITGDLKLEGIGGVPEFTSPTFGTKAPGAAPPPSSNPNNPPPGSSSGGASDGGVTINPIPSGSSGESDDGCNAGGRSAPSTGLTLGLAVAIAAFFRRKKVRAPRPS